MNGRKVTLELLFLWVCLFSLAGCRGTGKEGDNAVAEAEKAKAELAKAEAIIEEIRSERDELKEDLDTISENWEKAKSGLIAVAQARDELQDQVKALTEERDSAIVQARDAKAQARDARVQAERLGEQLKDKTGELRAYEEWVKELQVTIAGLEGQITEIYNRLTAQPVEEVSEESHYIREPDVQFVPTPQKVVDKMLELVNIKQTDFVYDLGCGDGRIVVTAAKKYGCKAMGYDIDPERVKESLENVKKNGVGHLVRIEQKDIFALDLSKADVITLYLLPSLNVKLIPQLEKLKPGTRIVSHDFDMKGVKPDKVITIPDERDDYGDHTIYLWTTPLKKEEVGDE